MSNTRKSLPPHWYRIYIDFCVLCGRTDTVRERVYGERPENDADRFVYDEGACGDHFA